MLLLLISIIILYIISYFNYLLFHSIIEGFAIIVAAIIYILGTRTYQYSKNNTFLFLSISYLYVAVLDFVHTITYKGMGIFPGFDSDTPTQLWIVGRFMEAAAFLLVLFLRDKKFSRKLANAIYIFVTVSLLLSIMVFKIFPACFIEGQGLTTFKITSEYIIIFILLFSAYRLYIHKDHFVEYTFKTIGVAMIITAISELAFTLYSDVYGIFNMLGHMLKIVSYYFIYSGIVKQGIDEPYNMISAEIKDMAIKDGLTRIYNREGMDKLAKNKIRRVLKENDSLGILMIDLDRFKIINDKHGHLFGDEVLRTFAQVLNDNIREGDIACRYGGDEFVVLAQGVNHDKLINLKNRICDSVETWIAKDKRLQTLGLSIGISLMEPGQISNINTLMEAADRNMYIEKQKKQGKPYTFESQG
ncbi:MAG TPA: GGDEF domain-containing protein [Clostridia bacterium]|nr:GGDEF domain-containing protein [Clostridia bacterium]